MCVTIFDGPSVFNCKIWDWVSSVFLSQEEDQSYICLIRNDSYSAFQQPYLFFCTAMSDMSTFGHKYSAIPKCVFLKSFPFVFSVILNIFFGAS